LRFKQNKLVAQRVLEIDKEKKQHNFYKDKQNEKTIL